MEKKRSVGVTGCGIIVIIIGFTILYLFSPTPKRVDMLYVWVHFIFGISLIVSGVFILRLKNWARILFLCQAGLWIILGLFVIYAVMFLGVIPGKANPIMDIIIILLTFFLPSFLSLYFFTLPKVREQFR